MVARMGTRAWYVFVRCVRVFVYVHVCHNACVRAYVFVCVCACVRASVRACVLMLCVHVGARSCA